MKIRSLKAMFDIVRFSTQVRNLSTQALNVGTSDVQQTLYHLMCNIPVTVPKGASITVIE